MSANKAERALAQLVASLAKTSEEDIEDVLRRLDQGERRSLRPLLVRHGLAAPEEARPLTPPRAEERKPDIAVPSGVSPWLAARITGESGAEGGSIRMTPLTRETLHAIVIETAKEPEPPRETRSGWRLFRKKTADGRS